MKKSITLLFSILFLLTPFSYALDNGEPTPDFSLPNHEGNIIKLSDYKDKIVVIEWFNYGCPFVRKHYDKDGGHMQKLQKKYTDQGIVWLSINSTNPAHQDFLSKEDNLKLIKDKGIKSSAFLIDSDGKVGKLYGAKTTPHMYILNKGKLVYQGAIDDKPGLFTIFGGPESANNYVSQALDNLLGNKQIAISATDPYGCSVKYAE